MSSIMPMALAAASPLPTGIVRLPGGEKVADAQVWLGDAESVPIVIKDPLTITIPRKARAKLKVAVTYDEPLPAPIAAGTRVATLVVSAPDVAPIEVPLYAGAGVGQLGPVGRLGEALRYLVWGGKF